jgi:hypothetical protein
MNVSARNLSAKLGPPGVKNEPNTTTIEVRKTVK